MTLSRFLVEWQTQRRLSQQRWHTQRRRYHHHHHHVLVVMVMVVMVEVVK